MNVCYAQGMRIGPFAFAAVVFSSLLVVACSDTSSGSGSNTPNSGPAKACADTADAVAKAAQRCGGEYKANYDSFVNTAAGGNCNNIASVRDEASLRATCIPSLSTVSCADLNVGKIDATCSKQLVRKASFPFELSADEG